MHAIIAGNSAVVARRKTQGLPANENSHFAQPKAIPVVEAKKAESEQKVQAPVRNWKVLFLRALAAQAA